MRISDLSSDVCSSDLLEILRGVALAALPRAQQYILNKCRNVRHAWWPFTATDIMSRARPTLQHTGSLQPCVSPSLPTMPPSNSSLRLFKIGRASCRERVCQYV